MDDEQPGDGNNWQYAIDIDESDFSATSKPFHFCRRRLWIRVRKRVGNSYVPSVKEVRLGRLLVEQAICYPFLYRVYESIKDYK